VKVFVVSESLSWHLSAVPFVCLQCCFFLQDFGCQRRVISISNMGHSRTRKGLQSCCWRHCCALPDSIASCLILSLALYLTSEWMLFCSLLTRDFLLLTEHFIVKLFSFRANKCRPCKYFVTTSNRTLNDS